MYFTVKTLKGLEDILSLEIEKLGGKDIKKGHRAVSFNGNISLLYKINLYSRTALSVLMPVSVFHSNSYDNLYKRAKKIEWSKLFDKDKTFRIDTTINSPFFKHSKFTGLKLKDAIVDHFKDKFGKRPSVNKKHPDIIIDIHINWKLVTISLNSSGEPLNRRGYRLGRGEAPLNEVLAAGMILLSGWDTNTPFIDPMCGSGTLLIEAGMIKYNIPANILRSSFAFKKWKNFDNKIWSSIKKESLIKKNKAINNINSRDKFEIFGSDKSKSMIDITKKNIENIGIEKSINLRVSNVDSLTFKSLKKENPLFFKKGTLITNPPFNKRIAANTEKLYQSLGTKIKFTLPDFDFWILSSDKKALKSVGLKPIKKINLNNGELHCFFIHYPILPLKQAIDS